MFTHEAQPSAYRLYRVDRMRQVALKVDQCVDGWFDLPDLLFVPTQHQFSPPQIRRHLNIEHTHPSGRFYSFAVRTQGAIDMGIDAGAGLQQQWV